ncbi:MAG: ABC transporter ATP-binding protein [Alphaproteobacteria bacterium]
MIPPLVRCHGLVKRFGGVTALDDVSLAIGRGEFAVLLGPSGSGKSTMLNILGGFLAPDAGRVEIDGRDVTAMPPALRPTTTVFQDYALFPHMTVGGNVGFGLMMRRQPRGTRRAKAREALALVGLPDLADRRPHELSGGQRQRVALARALVVQPLVLLLDEPLGALDLKLRRQMQDELKDLQRRLGTTFVHVTHDQEEAMSIADTVVVMRAGRVEDCGPPRRVYLRPATLFTATFMGESNLIEGRVVEARGGEVRVATVLGDVIVPGSGTTGDAVVLVIRPEQVHISPAPARIPLGAARVTATVFQGTYQRVSALAGPDGTVPLRLNLPPAPALDPGTTLDAWIAAADAVLLPRER